MGNPGSIEKVMVFGILVIILGILGVAIYGSNQTPTLAPSAGGGADNQAPLPAKTQFAGINGPTGSDDSANDGRPLIYNAPNDSSASDSKVPSVDDSKFDDLTDKAKKPVTAGDEERGPANAPVVPPAAPPKSNPANAIPATHVVASGDSLTKISRKYYKSDEYVDAIKKANGLKSDTVVLGATLKLPKVADEGATTTETPPPSATDKNAKKAADPKSSTAGLVPKTYVVENGDTIISISKKFYDSVKKVKAIQAANPQLKDPNKIPAGTVIKLP